MDVRVCVAVVVGVVVAWSREEDWWGIGTDILLRGYFRPWMGRLGSGEQMDRRIWRLWVGILLC